MAKLVEGQYYLSKSGVYYRKVIKLQDDDVIYTQDEEPDVMVRCTKGNFQFRYPTVCTEEKRREIDAVIKSM